jgi:hypothetical protein
MIHPEPAQCEATPSAELERQIKDPNISKNEREWWAAAEIERLTSMCADLGRSAMELGQQLKQREAEIDRLKNERKNCPPASESEYVRRLEQENIKLRAGLALALSLSRSEKDRDRFAPLGKEGL